MTDDDAELLSLAKRAMATRKSHQSPNDRLAELLPAAADFDAWARALILACEHEQSQELTQEYAQQLASAQARSRETEHALGHGARGDGWRLELIAAAKRIKARRPRGRPRKVAPVSQEAWTPKPELLLVAEARRAFPNAVRDLVDLPRARQAAAVARRGIGSKTAERVKTAMQNVAGSGNKGTAKNIADAVHRVERTVFRHLSVRKPK